MSDRTERLNEGSLPEPVAVVGMGCRYAGGADSSEEFWKALVEGQDAISEVPEQRWAPYWTSAENAAALRGTTRWGGFLEDIAGFDAEFFGIPPREAELMDPQQRILLEVTWEALEHAGIPPTSLAGGDAGVFVGVGSDDYGRRLLEDLPRIEAWTGIGASMCAAANRISHTLDLRGPSLAVDTACSASLVAVHLACQALASGETPLAIVGGVNVIAGPGLTMVLDTAGAISPDGRCKPFDAAANGYGRGEGCGILVLKRESEARRAGDRVLALIRGSAVNQDGRTNGIMAPSGSAQTHLLRHAYRTAGLDARTVDYVEAHGTGTRAGDPVEAGAMAEVFGTGRSGDRPCLIGSVKSNIGHLEAGAGVAGVIKAVLALRHAEIPPSLHFSEPNPEIPWESAGLQVAAKRTPWPSSDHPRRAGVSGYGYGGTLAHVILEQATDVAGTAAQPPVGELTSAERDGPWLFPVSAATEAGMRAFAGRLAEFLADEGAAVPLNAVGHTLTARRAHLTHRAVAVADNHRELSERLRAIAAGEQPAGVTTGKLVGGERHEQVWVFSGHGSQWAGMGRELLDTEPDFAAVLDETAPVFRAEIGFTPQEALRHDELDEVDVIQPVIFAVQVGLAAVWQRYGVEPAALIGHSVGEIAAAVVAGSLDVRDGARLVCRRSVLLRRVAGKGAMTMVDLPFTEVQRALAEQHDVVAAISASPSSTVVSGDVDAVERVAESWRAEDVPVRRIASDVAFHSPQMDPLLDELAAAADDIVPRQPRVPLYTTALDDPRATVIQDGKYWAANLRNPVRFSEAVAAAAADGYRTFTEISSHPVVVHSISEVLSDAGIEDAFVTGTLRRHFPERETLLAALGAVHCHGVQVDFEAFFPHRELAELPRTVWQHRRFWREAANTGNHRVLQHDVDAHTLLGRRTDVPGTTSLWLWQTHLDESCRPYPGNHPVQGVEIVPAAVLLNTFFAAAASAGGRAGQDFPALVDVSLQVPVSVTAPRELQVVHQDGVVRLATRLTGEDEDDPIGQESWLTHTTAGVEHRRVLEARRLDAEWMRTWCDEMLPTGFVVDRLASVGVAAMGFAWQVEELRRREGDGLFAVVSTGEPAPAASWAPVLDAALSIASVVFAGSAVLRMPAAIRRAALVGTPPEQAVISVQAIEDAGETVDVMIADLDGCVLAEIDGLRYGVLDSDPGVTAGPQQLVHEMAWRALELPSAGELDSVVVVGGQHAVAEALTAAGITHQVVAEPAQLEEFEGYLGPTSAVVVVPSPARNDEPVEEIAGHTAWLLGETVRRVVGWSGPRPNLWAITTGVRESESQAALGQSPVWGMGRVIGGEHPQQWGGIIDLDPSDPASCRVVPDVLRAQPGEDLIAVRDGEVLRARLVPVDREPSQDAMRCRPDGTYLITGGLGVLGLEAARWLAEKGARRIVLVSRSGLPPREQWDSCTDPDVVARISAVRAIEALGVTVSSITLDIADQEQAARALDAAALGLPPIRGVVHAAGVLDNRALADLDEESLRFVMRPKVDGAMTLHALFPPGSLDFFVLFSSCGYLLGLPGQASYGSANAFLDAFAAHRRVGGANDTVSFGWTSWRGLGMSTSSEIIDVELNARGTACISTTEAFRSWEFAERHPGPHFAVLRVLPGQPGVTGLPLLREVAVEPTSPRPDGDAPMWTELPPQELREQLFAEVRKQVANEMKVTTDELEPKRPLVDMGLDSVMTVVIRRRLEKTFQVGLPVTLLWNHPSVVAIAEYLEELLLDEEDAFPELDGAVDEQVEVVGA